MLATDRECPACGTRNRATAYLCVGCRHTLAGAGARQPDPRRREPPRRPDPEPAREHRTERPDRLPGSPGALARRTRREITFRRNDVLIVVGLGILLCVWDSLQGIGAIALYFLSALTHEIGHAAWATFFGAPSFPVISLSGHAAALHKGQSLWIAAGIWLFFGYMAYTMRREERVWKPYAWIALGYPVIAFTPLWHVLFLLAGHGGELVFAGVFFWRAFTGGFTHSRAERYLYGALAVYLAARNCLFHFGLVFSASYRARYHDNGSFGLVNDYIRVAQDLGTSLPAVAGVMLLVNLLLLPLLVWLFVRRSACAGPG